MNDVPSFEDYNQDDQDEVFDDQQTAEIEEDFESVDDQNLYQPEEEQEKGFINKWALLACLIAGLGIAVGIYLNSSLLPKQGPSAMELTEKTVQAIEKTESGEFSGTLTLKTTNRFTQGEWTTDIQGGFNDQGFKLNFNFPGSEVEIIKNQQGTFFGNGKQWTKIPDDFGPVLNVVDPPPPKIPGQEVKIPDQPLNPGFNFQNVSGSVKEGESINGNSSWLFVPATNSLFSEQTSKDVAPLLSTFNSEIWVDQKTFLPLKVEFDWSFEKWMVDYLTDTDVASLSSFSKVVTELTVTSNIEFTSWDQPVNIQTPGDYQELNPNIFDSENENFIGETPEERAAEAEKENP